MKLRTYCERCGYTGHHAAICRVPSFNFRGQATLRNVIVFGSGGTAKEVIGYLEDDGGYNIVAVVSTEPFNNNAFDNHYHVCQFVPPDTPAEYILAVADPAVKRAIVAKNEDRWMTYAHKSCHISPFATIGHGTVFMAGAMASGDANIGNFCTYNIFAQSGHDCVIGDYSTFSPYAETAGGCQLGEGVFLGSRAIVLPRLGVATGAKISAGAVVRKSILEAVTVYGDPAKPRAA
jgi:sugar O-acyltransferase (sialic acid O-acetyltransferase NeuD family)